MDSSFQARLNDLRLFLCDVDGVLTDATVFVGAEGEFKQFSILDGLGLKLLRREGIKVGWISNRPSPATQRRAEELSVDFLHQQTGSKIEAARKIMEITGLEAFQTCYMGDDIVDVGLLRKVGVAFSVPNAHEAAKTASHYITTATGGHGAVREVVELILKARNRWDHLVEEYALHGA